MKKHLKGLLLTIVMVLMVLSPNNSNASKVNDISRISGKNRLETSIEISKKSYDKANTVIITGYNAEVEALTGAILAAKENAPVLLMPHNSVPEAITVEINRLGASNVYILGGSNVISVSTENTLKEKYNVTRLEGSSGAKIASVIASEVNSKADEVFLVAGYSTLADALSIGPVSARDKSPILLSNKDNLPKETIDALRTLSPNKVTVIGGEVAISKKALGAIPAGMKIERISGKNREETSLNIAKKYFSSNNRALLANGWSYVDALVAGNLAAKSNSPILLSSHNYIGEDNIAYINDNGLNISLLGGNVVINDIVIDKIKGKEAILKPVTGTPTKPLLARNKIDLREEAIRILNTRPKAFTLKYAGNDITTTKDGIQFIRELIQAGSYHSSNIGQWYTSVYKEGLITEIKIELSYRTTDVEEAFINKEAKNILSKVIAPNMSQYSKVKAIHDYVVNTNVYTTKTISSPYSPYAFFKERKGVCNSTALSMSKLLNEAGIENVYMSGDAKGENDKTWGLHAWNKVKIDNAWYNIDTTWSFPTSKWGLHNTYYYFLASDTRFNKTHKPLISSMPKATDKRYEGKYDGNYNLK